MSPVRRAAGLLDRVREHREILLGRIVFLQDRAVLERHELERVASQLRSVDGYDGIPLPRTVDAVNPRLPPALPHLLRSTTAPGDD